MRRTSFIFIFCCLIYNTSFPQGENNNWYFGGYAGLCFNFGSPVPLLNGNVAGTYGSTCISDSIGNFLLAKGDNAVYNKNQQILSNSNGLYCDAGTANSAILIKKFGIDSTYYLFTVRHTRNPPPPYLIGLYYSVIDLRLNNGLGDIVPGMKNLPVPGGENVDWSLTATRHHNNQDVWLVTLDTSSNYLSYLINANGINLPPVVSPSSANRNSLNGGSVCQISISRDGSKLVMVSGTGDLLEFCSFNTSTGKVNPNFILNKDSTGTIINPQSAEFSTKGTYLYVQSGYTKLMQFETGSMDSALFLKSAVTFPTNNQNWGLQLAVDNKIYQQTYTNGTDLNVINNPENKGSGCNFQLDGLSLGGKHAGAYSPLFLQSYKAYIHVSDLCSGDSTHFSGDIWPPADSILWNFGDPASGTNNTSILANPSHTFSASGNYTVVLYVRHNDNRTDTTWKTITIFPTPQVNLGEDKSICTGESATFDAGSCSGCTFQWFSLPSGTLIGSNQLYTANLPGTYKVDVTNSDGCVGSDTIQVSISPPPQVNNNPLFKSICSGESTNITLSSTQPNTDYNWTATLTSGSVTGFSAGTGQAINDILTGTGVVTYSIIPNVGNCSGDAADFQVTVTPGQGVTVSITASDNNICAGTQVTYTATSAGPGTLTYDWQVNNVSQGVNNNAFSYFPANGDNVKCIAASSATTCVSNNPATSNSITMVVNPLLTPAIVVSPSINNICEGTSVIFTATATPAGGTNHYIWKVNNVSVGTDQPTYSYIPVNGEIVTCDLNITNLNCLSSNFATSTAVTMVVNANLTTGVTISTPVNPICGGIPVTIIAAPTNGGPTPSYQWQVNGVNVGTNQNTYTYLPVNGDAITCLMTTSLTSCVNPLTAVSNTITTAIIPAPVVSYTICTDSITTTNARPFKLKGGIPPGGTYSGPGVNPATGIFSPFLAGVGTKTITYSYTNAGLCSANKTKNIIVQNPSASICGNSLTDVRDGNIYQTVLIGTQCWMAEDLRYGTAIPQTTHQRDNCIPEKYVITISPPFGGGQEGAYQWDEMMDYYATPGEKGLCPPGWHVPAEAEWQQLFSNWINSGFAGSALKYSGFSGFDAELRGIIPGNTLLQYSGFAVFYWTSTAYGPFKAWAHAMNDIDPSVSLYPSSRQNAFAIRCLKD